MEATLAFMMPSPRRRGPEALLDQSLLDRLHACQKSLDGDIPFAPGNKQGTIWEGVARVRITENLQLPFVLHLELHVKWTANGKLSLRLYVVETNQSVRMYHNRPGHSDLPPRRLDGPHKHTNADRMMHAYEVSSSDVDPSTVEAALPGFLKEENIGGFEVARLPRPRVRAMEALWGGRRVQW